MTFTIFTIVSTSEIKMKSNNQRQNFYFYVFNSVQYSKKLTPYDLRVSVPCIEDDIIKMM